MKLVPGGTRHIFRIFQLFHRFKFARQFEVTKVAFKEEMIKDFHLRLQQISFSRGGDLCSVLSHNNLTEEKKSLRISLNLQKASSSNISEKNTSNK